MLQDIRNNATGLVAKIIIGLIVISFALFGIDSLTGPGVQPEVAVVNGDEITENDLLRVINQQKRRLIEAMGDNIDYNLIEDSRLRPGAMDALIQRRLMIQSAESLGMGVSPASVDRTIVNLPAFQADGQFSQQLYLSVLSSSGYTPAQFRQAIAEDMLINQLSNGLVASEFVTAPELERLVSIANEKRSFRYLTLPYDSVADEVSITEEQIEAYYQDNLDRFQREEQVKLDYILLNQAQFFEPVSEEAIREIYEAEIRETQQGESRRAAHLLLEITDERDRDATLALAGELRQRIEQGESFADLVAEYSDDFGSAQQGGDLGFTQGDTFPEPFEAALGGLTENEVSQPVTTDAGIHLIKLTAVNSASAPAFEQRRDAIARDLQLSRSRAPFVAATEDLRDLSFNAATLEGPAEKLNLQVQQSAWVGRSDQGSVVADPRVLNEAFSDEVLQDRNNSRVIELDESTFIVVRVNDYRPKQPFPLAEVREQIVSTLRLQQAQDLLAQRADDIIGQLAEGVSMEAIALERDLQWQVEIAAGRNQPAVNRQLLATVFQLPLIKPDAEPARKILPLVTGDLLVVQLDKVTPGDINALSEQEVSILRSQLARSSAEQSLAAFPDCFAGRSRDQHCRITDN